MPWGLVLQTNGAMSAMELPPTAQELMSQASVGGDHFFPRGVFLHKMLHLTNPTIRSQIIGGDPKATVSLSLLRDCRFTDQACAIMNDATTACNFHEIPRALDTQLFYGDIMMILTIDGSTIVSLTPAQYALIMDSDMNEALTTLPFPTTKSSRTSFSSEISPLAKVVRRRLQTPPPKRKAMDEDDDMESFDIDCNSGDDDDDHSFTPMDISIEDIEE